LTVFGPDVHYGHAYALILSGLVAISVLSGNLSLSTFGVYVACWFAYLLSAGAFGIIPDEIIFQSIHSMIFVISGFVLYLACRNSRGPLDTYYKWICGLVLIIIAMGFIQVFVGHGPPVATLGNQNFFAAFIAISAVFFIRKRWWIFLPVIGLALFCAKTSTAVAAAIISCAWYRWGWKGAGLSIIPAIAYFVLFKTPASLVERWSYWVDALTKMSNSWQTILFGVGPGVFWRSGNELHSEPVYLLFNLGIIGLCIVAAYIITSFRRPCDRRLQAAFLAIIIDSIGNHVMHTAPTALLAIIIFGLKDRTEMEA
jgi:hypothetical protein